MWASVRTCAWLWTHYSAIRRKWSSMILERSPTVQLYNSQLYIKQLVIKLLKSTLILRSIFDCILILWSSYFVGKNVGYFFINIVGFLSKIWNYRHITYKEYCIFVMVTFWRLCSNSYRLISNYKNLLKLSLYCRASCIC